MSLAPVVAAMLSVTPIGSGALTPSRVTINNQPGDQYDPHVDGDVAAYSASTGVDQIRYFRFSNGQDRAIPAPAGAIDLLSDIDDERIVFTRVTNKNAIVLFDVGTQTLTELAPAPNSNRVGVALGGQTAAFIDFGSNPNAGEVVAFDLTTNALTQITNDGVYDQSPAVSPDGNVIVWEACTTGALCDVWAARRSGSSWNVDVVSANPLRDTQADTNGSLVVFQRDDPANIGSSDIVVMNVNGTGEQVLELPGAQYNPSIRGNVVAFESRPAGSTSSDLFVVELTTNRIFQLTNTPDVNESLNDITVLANGDLRAVWQATEPGNLLAFDVFGATFTLPPPPGTCTPRAITLDAKRSYYPSRWDDDEVTFTPAMTFAIPAELPVISGNAGNKTAYLSFDIGSETVTCKYVGGSRKSHPRSASDVAAGLRYVFDRCTLDSHGHGGGGNGGGGWGGGCNRNDREDDDDEDEQALVDDGHNPGTPSAQWIAGAVITADAARLHVHDGDSWKPNTRVRVTLGEICPVAGNPPPTNPPLPPPGPPHETPHGGCSSTSSTLTPMFAL
ncbi:MAG: hypothetical protein ACO1OB_03710, partial [Archangium sp.]